MKPTKSPKNLKPKVVYISIQNFYDKANKILSTLPEIDVDLYFMRQIKLLKLYPFKNKDFLIVSVNENDLNSTIKKLYNQDVRLFMTSVSSTNFIILQDIFVKNKFTDAILFDTASSAFIPRIVDPPNMFRYATLDINATNTLLFFVKLFDKSLNKVAIISNNSVYANGIVDIFTKNGATLINTINDNFMAEQFDNFNVIIVDSDNINNNNNILIKLNNIAPNYNNSKILILSDFYAFSYSDIIRDAINVKLVLSNNLSHSYVLSWSSAQSLIYTQFVKNIFGGKQISTLITDLLFVLDYVYRVYSLRTHKVVKKMFDILNNSGIIYTTPTNTYNPGDHNVVSLALYEAQINNSNLEWTIHDLSSSSYQSIPPPITPLPIPSPPPMM